MKLALLLLLLHAPDGSEVRINPSEVTSLRSAPPKNTGPKVFAEGSNCQVSLADGKFITVIETCRAIQKVLEESHGLENREKPPPPEGRGK
jgi:hypothetical protein